MKHIRFFDLKEAGIVDNWPTLRRWIKRNGFPPGKMLGPNTRAWTKAEVENWITSRPVAVPDRSRSAHENRAAPPTDAKAGADSLLGKARSDRAKV